MKALKLLIVLIVLAVAAFFGAAWYSGNQMQKQYDESVAALSEQLKIDFPEVKITQQSYEKSFFSAKSVLTVEVTEKPAALLVRGWCAYIDPEAQELLSESKIFQQAHDVCTELKAGKSFAQASKDVFGKVEDIPGEPVHIKYQITNDIAHGPWISGQGFGMAFVKSHISVDADHLPAGLKDYIESLKIETVKSFSNEFNTHIIGQKIEEQNIANVILIGFDGFDLHMVSSDKRMKMDSTLTLPKFYYEILDDLGDWGPHRVEVTDVVSSTTGPGPDAPFAWFSSGKNTFSIKQINVTSSSWDDKWIRCENFKGSTNNILKNNLLDSDQAFGMQCSSNLVSPTLNITFDGIYKVKNLNVDSIINLAKAYVKATVKLIPDPENGFRSGYRSEQEYMYEILAQVDKILPDFVAPGPEMLSEYTISINEYKDILKMNSNIKFKPLAEDEKGKTWFLILQNNLDFNVAYSVSAEVFEKGLPEYHIDPLSQPLKELERNSSLTTPIVKKEGDRYQLEYGYKDGKIFLNEQEFSINDLFRR